jgi:DNA-binding NtrC family response regulator
VPVDVRVVAASNKDLAELVRAGKYREDLYYRIRVIHLVLPSLRQRREDIPLLLDHFVAKFNRLQGKDIAGVAIEAMARLLEHDFPGNIRELENIVEQAFVLCRGGIIELHHLPSELRRATSSATGAFSPMNIQAMEKFLIADVLRRYGGNRKRAARDLGINASTLYRKVKALQIEVPETDGRTRKR